MMTKQYRYRVKHFDSYYLVLEPKWTLFGKVILWRSRFPLTCNDKLSLFNTVLRLAKYDYREEFCPFSDEPLEAWYIDTISTTKYYDFTISVNFAEN